MLGMVRRGSRGRRPTPALGVNCGGTAPVGVVFRHGHLHDLQILAEQADLGVGVQLQLGHDPGVELVPVPGEVGARVGGKVQREESVRGVGQRDHSCGELI